MVGRVVLEPFDDDPALLMVELPDLGDDQGGIDPRPVNPGGGDVDLNRKVGVGIVGDILGSPCLGRVRGRQLLRLEVIALVGLQAAGDLESFPRRLTQAFVRNAQFLGNRLHELTEQCLDLIVEGADRGHQLQILLVIVNMDVAALGNRIHEMLIKRPIHASDHDTPVRVTHLLVEFVQGRDGARGEGKGLRRNHRGVYRCSVHPASIGSLLQSLIGTTEKGA